MIRSSAYSRRRFFAHSAAFVASLQLQSAASALGFAQDAPVCRLMAEQETGPFYVGGEMVRADIGEGKAGVPLLLSVAVFDVRNCRPLVNAAIDVWHCDAMGIYSGYTQESAMAGGGPQRGMGPGKPPPDPPPFGMDGGRPMGPPPLRRPSDKQTFLRGIQLTDARGQVSFQTIFPGYYQGRTNHIHFKVRVGSHEDGRLYAAGHTSHTGQIFFPEDLAVTLMAQKPYRAHDIHRTTQDEDGVFNGQSGELSLAKVDFVQSGNPGAGLRAHLITSVDPAATPRSVGPF